MRDKLKILLILLLVFLPLMVFAFPIGDVNGNNNVNVIDYILVRKHLLKMSILSGEELKRSDANNDGIINEDDYITIKKIILGEKIEIVPTPTITPTVTSIEVSSIFLNKSSIVLLKDDSDTLLVTIEPSNATNKSVTWISSNPSIVSVDNNGNILAKSEGTAIITVKSQDGEKIDSCNVKVVTIKEHNQQSNLVNEYMKKPTANTVKSLYKTYNCDASNSNCDKPNSYVSSITGNINLYQYDIKTKNKTLHVTTTNNGLKYYLIPNNTYYLESVNDPSNVEIVSITGNIRMISSSLINMRDLGGWKVEGGTVKYGKIFRSGTTNGLGSLKELNSLGITTVVDLRPNGEIDHKSAVESIRQVKPFSYYTTGKNVWEATEAVIKSVVEQNKNVLFNCNFGRDRTGTLAYIIEGILGVSLEDRKTDFELTYFSSPERTRDDGSFKSLINQINKYHQTAYEEEKFINWYLSYSSNKENDLELINNFRKIMINGNPHIYKLSGKNVIAG